MTTVAVAQRWARSRRCPICGGCERDPRGIERRCHGFLSSDGQYAHCSRDERSGALRIIEASGTYAHKIAGPCPCGAQHGDGVARHRSSRAGNRIEAVYVYRDETSLPLSEVVRLEGKQFRQRRQLDDGSLVWRLDGIRRVLYRLPELIHTPKEAVVYVAEGERDVDSLAARGRTATCNPGGAGKWHLVAEGAREVLRGRHVVIIPDRDTPGRSHALDVTRRLADAAASLRVLELPPAKDVTEWFAAGHTVDELDRLASERALTPDEYAATLKNEASCGSRAVVERPQIVITTDEPVVIDAAIAALARAPEVYVRGPEIVEVIADAPSTRGVTRSGQLVRIYRSPEARVRELLAREARWLRPAEDKPIDAHPPHWAVRAVIARGAWSPLRPLIAVAEAPTMRPDGTLLTTPGYDEATAIYLAPGVRVRVPDRPTLDDARGAVAGLLDVIAEFPAASEAARSAWLAGVLAAAVRPAIEGPTPIMIVDASIRGAGKSLLADAAAMITTGRAAARTTYVGDDSEMRKRITALALAGDPLVLLDNIVGELGCASLDAALTGMTWRDRLLGVSQMTADLPLRMIWWATGNGLTLGADLVRRALLIRLEPMTERPEERTGWRYPRLLDHVRAHREELLSAALTIVRAYVVAERPAQELTPMGSYEAWSDLVRSAIVWTGAPDPCLTIAEIYANDARGDALRRVIEQWPAAEGEPVTAAELLARAAPQSPWRAVLLEWCPARGSDELPTARVLGNRLRGIRRKVIGQRYFDAGEPVRSGATWILRRVGG
jgi:hypothetical protein